MSVAYTDGGYRTVVGSYNNGSQIIPLGYFSANNGQTWTLSSSFPTFGSLVHVLRSVSCEDSGHCIAVGTYDDRTPLSYVSDDFGLNWRFSDTLPTPVGDLNVLSGLSGNGF